MSINLPVVPRIMRTRTPAFPEFEFEWHEHIGKVYVLEAISPGSLGAEGTCIAEHCDTHARFLGFVQTYLRGVRKGQVKRETAT